MKKNQKHEDEYNQEHDVEILKAVAQAWHGHLSSSKTASTTSEFDAHRQYFNCKPTRFKLEAMNVTTRKDRWSSTSWDFGKSLWDSYEIVSVSKKLEREVLMLDNPFLVLDEKEMVAKKRKESKKSLRSLLRISSKRFNEVDLSSEGE